MNHFSLSRRWSVLGFFTASLFCAVVSDAVAQQERVLGLDVSAWQGNIAQTTWNNIHNVENRKFIFLRASRGGTTGYYNQNDANNTQGLNTFSQRYDDPYFVQNINRVTTAGMFAGPYHFSRPDIIESTQNSGGIANTGADEADHFIQMAGAWMRPGFMLPVHDLEAGQSQRTSTQLSQFTVDFSDRVYQVMGIRPLVYVNQSYANYINSTVPAVYPNFWIARYPNGSGNQFTGNVQTDNPPPSPSTANVYGKWNPNHTVANPYPDGHPWKFWQYSSGERLQSFNNGGSNLDGNVANGGIELVKDLLVPAVWVNDNSGDWSALANWNSGQTPVAPVTGPGQVTPVGTQTLPTPRLPGASGSGVTSGQHDTVILDRPNANITVTLSSGSYNIRKLYMRETLNITGGSLTINYVPSWDSTTNAAQFSGPVTLGGGSLSVHTLQVDTNRTFTLGGGTLTFDTIKLMPHSTTPAKIVATGDMNLNPLSNATAVITNVGGAGSIDLGGGTRSFNVGNGSAEVDLSIDVPISNGGLIKTGSGTMRFSNANTYSGGTTVSAGKFLVNNTTGSGTGTGAVVVNGGTLSGTGTINGAVTVNSAGTISPGTASAIGTLTLNNTPTLIGTNLTRIDRNGGSSLADKIVRSGGTLIYGGTLVVSNIGATLTGGEVFTNFAANSYSGAFAATNLPALDNGLNWHLGNLTVNGTIRVNRKPVINGATFTNTPGQLLQIPKSSLVSSATDPDEGSLLSLANFDAVTANGIALTSDSTFIYYSNHLNVADEFGYTISDGHGGSATGTAQIVAGVSTPTPPSIVSGPQSTTVTAGQNATFSVNVTGTQPMSYQWKFQNINIPGATSSTYTRTSAQPSHAGNYSVGITNAVGGVISDPALLTINFALTANATSGGSVGKNPDQEHYAPNSVVTLTAVTNAGFLFTGWSGDASGTDNPLDVTLTTNKTVTANFVSIDLTLDNPDPGVTFVGSWQTGTGSGKFGADYRFAVTTEVGASNVTYRPNINVPGNYDVYIWYPEGGNRSTNAPWTIVDAIGSETIPVNQQTNGGNWFLIGSSRPFLQGTNGYVRLSNQASATVVMADAVRFLYVGPFTAPEILTQPSDQTIGAGSNAVFTVAATGGNLSYAWRKNDLPLSNGGNVFGATSASLTLSQVSAADEASYTVVVQNSAGSITSAPPAVLTVIEPPAILSHPASRTNDAGTIATFTVSAIGTTPLSYQWRKNETNLSDFGNVSGATSPTLTLTGVLAFDAADYTVVVENSAGSATSEIATLTVNDPIILTHPLSCTNVVGTTATFTVAANGTDLTYQWQKGGVDLVDGGNLSGATLPELMVTNVSPSNAGIYRVIVRNANDTAAISSNATLVLQGTELIPPTIAFTIPTKTDVANFTLKGSAKDTAPGVVTEVWYRLEPETSFSPAIVSGKLWEAPNITLTPGTNRFYAYAVDSSGNHSLTNSKVVLYDFTSLLTVNIIGGGFVKNASGAPVSNGQQIPLLVGRPSSLTAYILAGTPATNFVFSNWFGSVTSTNLKLSFLMESNMTLTAQFITNPFPAVAGKYNGLFHETNGVTHATAGFITFKITPKSAYSGKILLDGNAVSISGKFDLSGRANKTLLRAAKFGKSDLSLELVLDWSTSSGTVSGTLGDGTWTAEIIADRAGFSLANPATNFAGRYTMLIPRGENSPTTSPGGFGYGLITNKPDGSIVLSGRLGDNTIVSQNVPISKDGKWPLYVPLYKNALSEFKGSLFGWISFTSSATGPEGNLSWIKTTVDPTTLFYTAGFSNVLEIISSPFNPPSAGARVLQFTNATALFSHGNLSGPMAWNATVASNNSVKVFYAGTDKVTLTLNAKTGYMTGKFPHANNGNLLTPFYGAILQQQNYAAGEFQGRMEIGSTTNQTGSILFQGND